MNGILIANFPKLSCQFTPRRLPFVCRYYLFAFWSNAGGRGGIWLRRILKMIFPLVRSLGGFSRGEFEFRTPARTSVIRFNPRNLEYSQIYNERIFKNGYEIEVSALLDLLLPESGVFYDIGSNWGYHVLMTASRRPRLNVHAFEPAPETFQDLTGCLQQAGLAQSVTCHNFALSSCDGTAFIRVPDHINSGSAEVSTAGGDAPITTRRLDALDLPKPDVIKMDVENHELEVLKGAVETLRSKQPYIIFENKLNLADLAKMLEIFEFLAVQGYRFFCPAVLRDPGGRNFLLPCNWLPSADSDRLALVPFTTLTRLICPPELNVFACHESRLPELMETFQAWKE